MTITNEILAALVAVNLFVMGINVKFLFALWADLKDYKEQMNQYKEKIHDELKDIREHQSVANVGFIVGCRAAQKECADSIRLYIRQESNAAKEEARQIAEQMRELSDQTATELKDSEESRYHEFRNYGIELNQKLILHTHDDDGRAVIK